MQPNSSLRRIGSGILIGGTGVVTAGLLALAIRGSAIIQGNLIFDVDRNPYASIVSGVNAVETPIGFGVGTTKKACTSSGGLINTNSCYISSPYASGNTYGLPSGQTGTILSLTFEVISNPKGFKYDCWRAGGPTTASGGGALQYIDGFYGTGTIITLNAGSGVLAHSRDTLLGPTQGIACNTLTGSGAGADIRLSGIMRNTRIGRVDMN